MVGRWRSQGHIDVMIGQQRVDDQGVWRFTGGGDVASVARPAAADAGGAVRSTLTISPDRSGMTAKWERSDDGANWQPWMDMTFTRVAGRHPPQPTPTRDRLPAAHGGVDAAPWDAVSCQSSRNKPGKHSQGRPMTQEGGAISRVVWR
jgi:hypothetical protein